MISASHLKALSGLTATKDVRYYLNGVNLRVLSTHTLLQAADGVVAGQIRYPFTLPMPEGDYLIPADLLKQIAKVKGAGSVHFSFTPIPGTETAWTVEALVDSPSGVVTLAAKGEKSRYPDCTRIFHWRGLRNPGHGQYNPYHLARIGQAVAILKGKEKSPEAHFVTVFPCEGKGICLSKDLPEFTGAVYGVGEQQWAELPDF